MEPEREQVFKNVQHLPQYPNKNVLWRSILGIFRSYNLILRGFGTAPSVPDITGGFAKLSEWKMKSAKRVRLPD